MNPATNVRIDKWLWAIRLFKTRSLATRACAGGKIKVNGVAVKPSRALKVGDIISAEVNEMTRTIKVRELLEKRVGAKLIDQFLEDLTPASEFAKPKEKFIQPFAFRPKGSGRPTKKDRRNLDSFLE